jgi:hypothetical protein
LTWGPLDREQVQLGLGPPCPQDKASVQSAAIHPPPSWEPRRTERPRSHRDLFWAARRVPEPAAPVMRVPCAARSGDQPPNFFWGQDRDRSRVPGRCGRWPAGRIAFAVKELVSRSGRRGKGLSARAGRRLPGAAGLPRVSAALAGRSVPEAPRGTRGFRRSGPQVRLGDGRACECGPLFLSRSGDRSALWDRTFHLRKASWSSTNGSLPPWVGVFKVNKEFSLSTSYWGGVPLIPPLPTPSRAPLS